MRALARALWDYLTAKADEAPTPEPMPSMPENFIDYRTRQVWGHDIMTLWADKDRDGFVNGSIIVRARVKRGDLVFWNTRYGHAVGQVHEVETRMDPGDLHHVTLEVIARVAEAPKPTKRGPIHSHNHGSRS